MARFALFALTTLARFALASWLAIAARTFT
jgi:hypothetical protein